MTLIVVLNSGISKAVYLYKYLRYYNIKVNAKTITNINDKS